MRLKVPNTGHPLALRGEQPVARQEIAGVLVRDRQGLQ
jgi:hypothetical protein